MSMVIGIDVGGSTTKIIGISDRELKNPMLVKAADPITSLFGAFGKYIYDNGIDLEEIDKVMLTGVGSAYITQPLYGLPTAHIDEFVANGLGAIYNSKLKDVIVVSMGTGTSFVRVNNGKINHIGGISIGGGTILGLSRLLLKTQDIDDIVASALRGNYENIDLQIKDICNAPLPGLPPNATASTFGKACSNAPLDDVAAGIIRMVLQSIGQSVILSALNSGVKDFILIGNLATLPQCKEVYSAIEMMYNCKFHIPEIAEYRTALGAALAYIHNEKYKDISL